MVSKLALLALGAVLAYVGGQLIEEGFRKGENVGTS